MDQQNHFFSLIAVFLALGIGILIGASMGENALIHNQIAVIENLRNEIMRYKDEINTYFSSLTLLKEELMYWESLEEEYLNPLLLENKLLNCSVKVIVREEIPEDLLEFLKLTGASYRIYVFDEEFSGEKPVLLQEFANKGLLFNSKAELYNNLGNELILSSEKQDIAGDSILNILKEKKLLEIVPGENIGAKSDGKSVSPFNEIVKEIFIATNSSDPFFAYLVEMIGREQIIIWEDFIDNYFMSVADVEDSIAGAEGDSVSFSRHGASRLCGRLELLELINNII